MSTPVILVKGQNAPLSASSIVVTVDLGAAADLSALLVTADGRVRTDADFVFFNQPDGPGVRCRQPEPGRPWRIEIDLPALPAAIDQVRVVVTLADTGARFGAFAPPVATVSEATGSAGAGRQLVRYQATGLSSESIVIVLEVYRRGTDWKVRAVGQGYAGGLAALITDHGVSVDDAGGAPDPAPAAAPTPVPAAFASPPPAPPAPPLQPASSPWPAPSPSALSSAFPPPPSSAAAPAPGFPPPSSSAAPAPTPGLPAASPPAPLPTGEVSLVKGRSVSLLKGQRVSLRKENGASLTTVRMGLGWDQIKKRGFFAGREAEIDLDASALLFAGQRGVDVVFFNQLSSKDGSIRHLGDNRTGAGEGDDESIMVDLARVPAEVTAIVFIVTSYEGQTFEQVANAFCRLVDQSDNSELARYTLGSGGPFTAMVMAKVFRESGQWKLQAIGAGIQARTPGAAATQLGRFL